jgi:4-diphosphocytidyl-2-C-methyl-D-erythritol kinase
MQSRENFLSPCKINLFLNVLRRRQDGFHDLESIFHRVDFFDELTIRLGKDDFSFGCSDPNLPTDSSNLVVKAAHAFFKTAGIPPRGSIFLEKRIPSEAGLGGGSANAATTLTALNSLHNFPLGPDQLHAIAAGLGSDVPFFLMGRQALGTGRGEILSDLEPFPALKGAWIVLVRPDFGVPTGWAFSSLREFGDRSRAPEGSAAMLADRLVSGAGFPPPGAFFNSFELPVFRKFPLLEILRDQLLSSGAMVSLLSGSGSAVFGIFPDELSATAAGQALRDKAGDGLWMATAPLG